MKAPLAFRAGLPGASVVAFPLVQKHRSSRIVSHFAYPTGACDLSSQASALLCPHAGEFISESPEHTPYENSIIAGHGSRRCLDAEF